MLTSVVLNERGKNKCKVFKFWLKKPFLEFSSNPKNFNLLNESKIYKKQDRRSKPWPVLSIFWIFISFFVSLKPFFMEVF